MAARRIYLHPSVMTAPVASLRVHARLQQQIFFHSRCEEMNAARGCVAAATSDIDAPEGEQNFARLFTCVERLREASTEIKSASHPTEASIFRAPREREAAAIVNC
jgi:hypothetical protein